EDRRRKEEDEKRRKEDARRRDEDARRLKEDKERQEQKRTKQYAQAFGQEIEGGASRRKQPHQRQSYSPPKHGRPSGQTRASSHYIPRGQQTFQKGAQQFEEVVAQGRRKKKHGPDKEQDSIAEEEALQRRIDKIKADRVKRAEEEKERVALERKSRSVERAVSAQSQQKASSSQRPESDRQSSAEQKYSKERGPSPLDQQKQAQRSQSTGERSHRSRSRDSAKSSGSHPSPLADPATRYHQQVTQELQQYKGPLEFFRGGATSMASMSCG
ncbi:MAG: hypothetical protein GY821_07945, partial [Gammaproteobacteria bacterium]|nr:hypothetical protein [Gammaproteobacteria bacterium]